MASVMPARIRKEILAAGVARELMAAPTPFLPKGQGRVRAATKQAPDIVEAMQNLRQTTRRGGPDATGWNA